MRLSLPLLGVVLLAILAIGLQFNGLYGQDAHEYLRQSLVFKEMLSGHTYAMGGQGAVDFPAGYPLLGSLFQLSGLSAAVALQVISTLSAGWCLWLFDRLLMLLTPGTSRVSRLTFIGLLCLGAPLFIRAGISAMSDALGLALTLAALLVGLKACDARNSQKAIVFILLAGAAVCVRYALAALLLPLAFALLMAMLKRRQWIGLLLSAMMGLAFMLSILSLKSGLSSLFNHSLIQHWSVFNLFHASFENANGHSVYLVINLLYATLYPVLHPGFCILLPGLFLLLKKTDLHLPAKKNLAACLLIYLLMIGGIAHQNVRYLIPAYLICLLLLFPAWDRFFAYGFYFFKKTTYAVLLTGLVCQLAGAVWILQPIIARNRLEIQAAHALKTMTKPGDTLYAFDIDVALKTYLPDIHHINLWEKKHKSFTAGGYVLFNEKQFAPQWAGQNPMLNWEALKQHYTLTSVMRLEDGWGVYRIEGN